ncbi:hypothetical protein KXW98_002944 [Aspergillus fumigatus]|uniref:Peroxin 22-like protein n=3 Tax=Aspergillus fumigatus TaxID=746128 RepID=Q4WRD8_ASPFU|nr:conserved hypothetical protein [Aspergillus fumigatus Af293]EDP56881.1 conserved hypothetical protein [Aspergillus fumigatus A1163]KAF4269216.1 hypothetical protein CNMCM8714_008860 [Aspergillus fumigatus]KMK55548.1 hypothetical protein Y699_08982 [Aspergillus fumigatus Z5]EAL90994.1 conserved hypothetical protein [Aspergillus fumigatus Af293]KAF4279316.1 hypothetical protein CNMCM8057_006688 [Aspergillus fumigatus]
MSFPYSQDARRRRVGAGTGFSSSGRRTIMGYWVPLALTVGIATIGIAAWIWSERSDDDDNNDEGEYPLDDSRDDRYPPPGAEGTPAGIDGGYARSTGADIHGDDVGMMARMQGALRRTPSPQQIFDGASKRVAAGMAAAGAFMGSALTSIREEDRGDFEDHSRWSEEVRSRATQGEAQAAAAVPTMSGALPPRSAVSAAPALDKKKKTVAIVVSSELASQDPDDFTEHASILSHLPEHVDSETAKIFVLIYAPGLKHAPNQGGSSNPTLSVTSSYSNIAPEEARSPGETLSGDLSTLEPRPADEQEGASPFFRTLYTQAQAIVDKENTIMPFSTATGYVHLVRHLSPDIVYVQESLTGKQGDAVQHISGWVRQVVVVVGDEGGRGGLIDSEDESVLAEKGEKWWQKEGMTGIGKRIDVVDVHRTGEDWRRRVSGHD